MAARVCRTCKLSYENSQEFNPCPICGSETAYVQNGVPDEDIEVAVAEALHLSKSQMRMHLHRRKTFVRLGFAGAMLDVLVDSPVDLHTAQALIRKGCPPDLAARILL